MAKVDLSIAGASLALVLISNPASAQTGAPQLSLPLRCEIGRTCEVQNYVDTDPGPGAKDYRCQERTYQAHTGVDFRVLNLASQRKGVDVVAAAAGRVARLRDGVQDISIRAAGAPSSTGAECGNGVVIDHGGGWETQYCHLAKGSVAVKVGQTVVAGQTIARVGLSGNTEFPHLHLTVRQGTRMVDPFAPEAAAGRCGTAAGSLWTPAAQRQLAYKRGAVLQAGFASGPVSVAQADSGEATPLTTASPALVAWVQLIGLEGGDMVELEIRDPAGAVLIQNRGAPMDRAKAQQLTFVGKKRPAGGWRAGTYAAESRVIRGGQTVIRRQFTVRLAS